MIPLAEQERLRGYFAEQFTGGVKIEHFTQRPLSIVVPGREICMLCAETQQLLQELRALSPKISVRVHELEESKKLAGSLGVDRAPATIIRGQANRPIVFYGFFGGTLFPVLVEALVWASQGKSGLDSQHKRRLERVRDDTTLRVFVTPTSPYATVMMQAAFQLGLESRRVKATVIEAGEFPRLVESLQLRAVPYTIIGDHVRFVGAVPIEALIDQIAGAGERRPSILSEGLVGRAVGPNTPLQAQASAVPRTTRSGLILPGR